MEPFGTDPGVQNKTAGPVLDPVPERSSVGANHLTSEGGGGGGLGDLV